jgi:hypothetical protein
VVPAFVLVLALNAGNLRQPPVWDTAFSVYSAALELAGNGFDLAALARLPGYHAGGPTMHGSSIVTLATATVLWAVETDAVRLPVLHVLHVLVAAIGLTAFWRLARPALGTALATAVGIVALLQPAFLVQTGRLYLEVPAFTCAMLALSAHARGRTAAALGYAALAAGIKESGIAVAGALALAELLDAGPWRRRLSRAALFAAAAAPGLLLLSYVYTESPFDERYRLSLAAYLDGLRLNAERYLWTAPDVAALLAGFLAIVAARLPRLRRGLAGDEASRSSALAALFGLCLVAFFFCVLPVSGRNFQVLTRYYVPVIPVFLFVLAGAIARRRIAIAAVCALGILFAANRDGILYPSFTERYGNDFSIAERSGEYRDLLEVQRECVRELVALAETRPVFYELPVHFLVSRPGLGYVDRPLANGHSILTEQPYRAGRLGDFPDRFVMVRLSPWLGARRIDAVLDQASRSPRHTVATLRVIRRGPFEATLLEVRRKGDVFQTPETGTGSAAGGSSPSSNRR